MSKIWEPQPIQIYNDWVRAIIDEAQDKLTDWESNFVDSISNQLDNGRQLTKPQAEILERIYSEKTS